MDPTEYRSPRGERIFVVGFLAGLDAFVIGSAIASGFRGATVGGTIAVAVFLAVLVLPAYRALRVAVIIDGDELIVRNFGRNLRIRRDQVRRIRRGRSNVGRGETIIVETAFAAVALDVFRTTRRSAKSAAHPTRQHHRQDDALRVLCRWAGHAG